MLEGTNTVINTVSGVIYQPWCVPLILLLGGIILTISSKFIQVRLLKESFKVILEKPKSENGISSFGALMVSTASRVGAGNIVGVATVLVFVGAVAGAGLVWDMADLLQGMMVMVNVPVILLLMKPAVACLEDYCKQKKEGKDPEFIADDIGIKEKLDFWNE